MQNDVLYVKIGALIRGRREKLDMTQQRLAEMVGLSRASIANIESRRQNIYLHQLFAIAHNLGIDVMDIIPRTTFSKSESIIPADVTEKERELIEEVFAQEIRKYG